MPSNAMRKSVADKLLKGEDHASAEATHELRDGWIRIRPDVGSVFRTHCGDFSECGCSGCGCNRLRQPQGRRRFRQLVARRTEEALRGGVGLRMVTIGSGGLLTDFEILLDLWSQGVVIESVVAIDTAYAGGGGEHARALSSLSIFFAPAKIYSFGSSADYLAACEASPSLYGEANLFVYCDAGAVPHEVFSDCACAALLPGCMAFELSNSGGGRCNRALALDTYLPERLRSSRTSNGSSSMRCMRCVGGPSASSAAAVAGGGASKRRLDDVDDPLIRQDERAQPHSLFVEAVAHLNEHARERAESAGLSIFRVVYKGTGKERAGALPRMPVRAEPSRNAAIAGSRTQGDEILVDEVRVDGWVRLSDLDTYAGYQAGGCSAGHDEPSGKPEKPREMWMLIRADDVGELLQEVILDGDGKEVDDDDWMPGLV